MNMPKLKLSRDTQLEDSINNTLQVWDEELERACCEKRGGREQIMCYADIKQIVYNTLRLFSVEEMSLKELNAYFEAYAREHCKNCAYSRD